MSTPVPDDPADDADCEELDRRADEVLAGENAVTHDELMAEFDEQ